MKNVPTILLSACKNLFPPFQLMGLWYGSEIITHHEDQAYESIYDSCVVVHLADANDVSRNQSIKRFLGGAVGRSSAIGKEITKIIQFWHLNKKSFVYTFLRANLID